VLPAIDDDAALFQQLAEKSGGEFGGIFKGEGFVGAGVIERRVAPQREDG